MSILLALLFYAALLGFIFFSIVWVAKKAFFRNTSKGKHGLYALTSLGVFLFAFILFNFTTDSDPDKDTANAKNSNHNNQEEIVDTSQQVVDVDVKLEEEKLAEANRLAEEKAQLKAEEQRYC